MQRPVEENGQKMDALGTDNVIKVLHAVGMLSTLVVLVQLAGSRGLPLLVTFVTALAIVGRLIFVNRYAFLHPELQQLCTHVEKRKHVNPVAGLLGMLYTCGC